MLITFMVTGRRSVSTMEEPAAFMTNVEVMAILRKEKEKAFPLTIAQD